MFQASHVMTQNLITLSPETMATEAIRTLLKNQISGAPIVDRDGQLVGIISEFALLYVIFDEATATTPVGELMTQDVITVNHDAPLCDVAQAFLSLKIRRLPVLRDGKLVGQVSRRDVLRSVVGETGRDGTCSQRDELVHREPTADSESRLTVF